MARFLVAATFFAAFAVVAAGLLFAWGKHQFESPGPLEESTAVVIPQGTGLQRIAEMLHQADVLERPEVFVWGARLTQQAHRLKAGEFAFPAGVSPKEALDIVVSGERVVRRVTIPEGLVSAQVVDVIQRAEGLTGEIETVPPQGALLPETYHYHWGDARSDILRRMEHAMEETLDALWPERTEDLPFDTREEALTLASIVEKETSVDDERPLVAGVFINRLRRGMRLQSDPTVVYAATEGLGPLGRRITRSDLDREHSHNTYRIDGLPPSPIANPGRDSIAAALNPVETDYLYFVADGEGGHAFARTLREHNRNVARWRRSRDNGE